MYRGQDIGDRKHLIETCLAILEEGSEQRLYEVLPHLSVVRSNSFLKPLLKLLRNGNRGQREFAAVALGSLGNAEAIEPLYQVFMIPDTSRGEGSHSLQVAIIHALGEIGDPEALAWLWRIYQLETGEAALVARRKSWVVSAVGNLAQQGCESAVEGLVQLLKEEASDLRVQAVIELGVAYWHRPSELPEEVLRAIISLTQDRSEEVRKAALSSLSDLARLGCTAVEEYL